MKLFDFFIKPIKTAAQLLFPEKRHKLEKSNDAKPTETQAGGFHPGGTKPARITPAAPPVNTARGRHQKPEFQPAEPTVTEACVIEEREPLLTATDVHKPIDEQEPASLPLKPGAASFAGVKNPGLVTIEIKFSVPQVIHPPADQLRFTDCGLYKC